MSRNGKCRQLRALTGNAAPARRLQASILRRIPAAFAIAGTLATPTFAGGTQATARAAMDLFAENCFSPYLTADKARRAFALSGITYDFYDLDPFANADPSPAQTQVTPGTDRRCEIAFPGDYAEDAAQAAAEGLAREGITEPAALPARYAETDTTTLLAARRLNPRRIAIVHVGTRQTSRGPETYLRVERLTPSAN